MSKKVVIIIAILVIAVAGAVLYLQERPEEKPEVVAPETFTKVNMGTIDSLDPHYQYDTASAEIYVNIYENLIKYKDSDVEDFEPLLSTEVPSEDNGLIRNDGQTYAFPIREDVTFHEGGELTPEDVKYSFLRALIHDREGGPVWMLYEPLYGVDGLADLTQEVAGVEDPKELTEEESREVYERLEEVIEVDGDEVVFHLPDPYPAFLSIIVRDNGVGAIMDKDWAVEQGCWDGDPETIAEYHDPEKESDPLFDKTNGTGPFQLEEWEQGEQVELARFEDYWREPAELETVVISMVDEWSTRNLMLEQGDADIVYTDKQYLSQVRDVENVEVIDDLPQADIGTGLMNWDINTEGNEDVHSGEFDGEGIPGDFFSDEHVRKGFAYAMNYDAFIEEALDGGGHQARGPIPEPFVGYDEDSPVYEMDLEKAEEEFREAFDGELWDKGFEITILYNSGNSERKTACDMLKDAIEDINDDFKVNVRGIQWDTYLDRQVEGKFTLGFIGWSADFADPHNFTVPFMSKSGTYGTFKGENYHEWADEHDIEEKLEAAVKESDSEEREEMYRELQEMTYEYATDIYLYQSTAHKVMRDWVQGWEYDPILYPGEYYYSLSKGYDQ
ncbi:MAG: ABC transporter substrate-binding protein [Halanaerobiaceae bacterium]